jgi:acyl-CoA oxidase
VHSPTMTSAKWWIGSLGRTADHAVVMAQLSTNGKPCGPHTFVVPLRDPVTRKPLPGRTIGDIGPKAGYNTMDNGTLLLDQVRIPHVNMLARFSSVDKETGKYTKPKFAQLSYGTMTFVRRLDAITIAGSSAIDPCQHRPRRLRRPCPRHDRRRPLLRHPPPVRRQGRAPDG